MKTIARKLRRRGKRGRSGTAEINQFLMPVFAGQLKLGRDPVLPRSWGPLEPAKAT